MFRPEVRSFVSRQKACDIVAVALVLMTSGTSYAQAVRPMAPILIEPSTPAAPDTGSALPIQGGTLGQVGATGWRHTGTTLKSCESYLKGADYVLDGRTTPLVVDSCSFSGHRVLIQGNVTLRKSRVVNDESLDCADPAVTIAQGAGPVLIEDVEIGTSDANASGGARRQDRTICINKGNTLSVTLRRVWTHDTMRGLDFTGQNNIHVEDSYLGPNVSPPIGYAPGTCQGNSEREHASAVRAAGGTYNISFTNTVLHIGSCSWASGLIATYPENGANHDWLIQGGLWIIGSQNDGAYGISAGYTPPEKQNYNYTVKDLYISTQNYAQGCPSGCAQSWAELGGARAWTNVRKYNPGRPDHDQAIGP